MAGGQGKALDGRGWRDAASPIRLASQQQSCLVSCSARWIKRYSFEEWFDMDQTLFDRMHREWRAERALPESVDPTDVPFRLLLARALRQIPDRNERVRQTDWFSRNASK